ncbi:MAG: DMT family transporter [Thaumarchaeota archaeon]|nr:DMT family transporter [Nitrososphaerota archaeon]
MVETAIAVTLLASLFFSTRDILVKKSLRAADLYSTLLISILFATPFSALVAFLAGELGQLPSLSMNVIGYYAVAGILQFAFTRGLYYASIGIIGASRTTTVIKVDSLLSVVFAIIFLREEIDLLIAASITTITAGIFIVSFSEPRKKEPGAKNTWMTPRFLKGFVFAASSAVGSGLVPLFIRLGAMSQGPPLLGTFLASFFALMVLAPLALLQRYRSRVTSLKRGSVKLVTWSALFATSGQLSKFAALALAPIVIVAPILNAQLLLTVLFSYLFIQRVEQVNYKVITGAGMVILGMTSLTLAG